MVKVISKFFCTSIPTCVKAPWIFGYPHGQGKDFIVQGTHNMGFTHGRTWGSHIGVIFLIRFGLPQKGLVWGYHITTVGRILLGASYKG